MKNYSFFPILLFIFSLFFYNCSNKEEPLTYDEIPNVSSDKGVINTNGIGSLSRVGEISTEIEIEHYVRAMTFNVINPAYSEPVAETDIKINTNLMSGSVALNYDVSAPLFVRFTCNGNKTLHVLVNDRFEVYDRLITSTYTYKCKIYTTNWEGTGYLKTRKYIGIDLVFSKTGSFPGM